MGLEIREIQSEIHQTAIDHGWWEDTPEMPLRTVGDCLALIHSEVSEALEEFRNLDKNGVRINDIYYPDGVKPEGVPVELADTIIRILDFAARHAIDMEYALAVKMKYNETRPYRHGGKAL